MNKTIGLRHKEMNVSGVAGNGSARTENSQIKVRRRCTLRMGISITKYIFCKYMITKRTS